MGGLDLCFGRFELDDYPLCEPNNQEEGLEYFPGQDYTNVRIKDFENVDQYNLCLIDKNSQPRMPWRDIAVKLKGKVVKDVIRHFIQYWNFAKYESEGKKNNSLLLFQKSHRFKERNINKISPLSFLETKPEGYQLMEIQETQSLLIEGTIEDLLSDQFEEDESLIRFSKSQALNLEFPTLKPRKYKLFSNLGTLKVMLVNIFRLTKYDKTQIHKQRPHCSQR